MRGATVVRYVQRTLLTVIALVLMMLVLTPAVLAHTGEGVSIDHVIIEIGTWALAVTAVIGIIVGVFWVRARVSGR